MLTEQKFNGMRPGGKSGQSSSRFAKLLTSIIRIVLAPLKEFAPSRYKTKKKDTREPRRRTWKVKAHLIQSQGPRDLNRVAQISLKNIFFIWKGV